MTKEEAVLTAENASSVLPSDMTHRIDFMNIGEGLLGLHVAREEPSRKDSAMVIDVGHPLDGCADLSESCKEAWKRLADHVSSQYVESAAPVEENAERSKEVFEKLPPFTIESAHDWIDSLKASRPTCDACEKKSYDTLFKESPGALANGLAAHKRDGWEHLVDEAGIVRRCATCAASRRHPWADRLDAERVRDYVMSQRAKGIGLHHFEELKQLVEP